MKKLMSWLLAFLLFATIQQASAQVYEAVKESKAQANPVKPARTDAGKAFIGKTCGDQQKLFCDGVQNLQYKVCMVKGIDLATAQKVSGNIELLNGEAGNNNYYLTLYYSWKGTNVVEQNVKVPAGGNKTISFSLNAQPNYTGGINNVQVWVKECRKVIDP
jgi:hypothetical protein